MERIEKIKSLLEQTPNDCFLWHALGLEFIKINDINSGIEHFKKVLLIDENYLGTYYHLAKSLEKLNDITGAILIYQKGIEIAKQQKDNHAKNELQMALEDIIDE